jgi:hypothetical protein
MPKLISALLLAAATLAAPAASANPRDPDADLRKLLEGRVAGTPVDCINLSSITSSEIVDGRAIVYRSGRKLFVNQPRGGAEQLGYDKILVTKTFGGQLCSIDTVNLLDRTSRFPSGFVQLGKFVPYTKPRPAR